MGPFSAEEVYSTLKWSFVVFQTGVWPLHSACTIGSLEIVRLLLHQHARWANLEFGALVKKLRADLVRHILSPDGVTTWSNWLQSVIGK